MILNKSSVVRLLGLCGLLFATLANAGALTDNIVIHSKHLGYDLQYRVLTPETWQLDTSYPVIFITDGQMYLDQGHMDDVVTSLTSLGSINTVIVVFVDSRDPGNLRVNRRNQQFMCSTDYAAFFRDELVPAITLEYGASHDRDDRLIMGISFGGLNAACFGVLIPDVFGNAAMQSPASDKHLKVVGEVYKDTKYSPVKMFLSVGSRNDNAAAGRKFLKLLTKKGYDVTYVEVPFGHSWNNWRPLLDDVLIWFAGETGN
jgi:enterochelin esterase-like enzyme